MYKYGLVYTTYMTKCEFCRDENASWLSASVHADCANLDGFGKLLPESERECSCDCQIA